MKNPANNLEIFILELSNQHKQKIDGILPKFCFTTIQLCAQEGFWYWNKNFQNQNWCNIEWIRQLDNNSQAWVLVQLFLFPITNFKVFPVVSAGSFFMMDPVATSVSYPNKTKQSKLRPEFAYVWMFFGTEGRSMPVFWCSSGTIGRSMPRLWSL